MTALDEKLFSRVCSCAKVRSDTLPPEAREYIQRRVQKWVSARKCHEHDIEHVAHGLRKRFELPVHNTTVGSLQNNGNQHQARSATAEPQTMVPAAGQKKSTNVQKRCSSVEPDQNCSSGAQTSLVSQLLPSSTKNGRFWARPQVIKRLQNINTDKEYYLAIKAEEEQIKSQHEQERLKKLERNDFVRKEMQRLERERLELLEEKRKERDEGRKLVVRTIEELKDAHIAQQTQRVERHRKEKIFLESQREIRRKELERRKEKDQLENAHFHNRIQQELVEQQRAERERTAAVKESLLEFLNASHDLLVQKKKQVEEERLVELQRDAEHLEIALQEPKPNEAVLKAERKCRHRQHLQNAVSSQYASITEQERTIKEKEAERTMKQLYEQEEGRERRARTDLEKKLALRSALVRSLDEEINRHELGKKESEEEKRILRMHADQELQAHQQLLAKEKSDRKQKQRALMKEIDDQNDLRLQGMMKPQQIKIGSRN